MFQKMVEISKKKKGGGKKLEEEEKSKIESIIGEDGRKGNHLRLSAPPEGAKSFYSGPGEVGKLAGKPC